jgi:hypothetical protein
MIEIVQKNEDTILLATCWTKKREIEGFKVFLAFFQMGDSDTAHPRIQS